jgi:carboxypeptidase Q
MTALNEFNFTFDKMFRETAVLYGCFLHLAILQAASSIPVSKHVSHNIDIDSQIKAYENVSQKIINFVTKDEGKHQTFNRLAAMTDKFGNRLVGSDTLEVVIDYMLEQFKADGLENVHGEEVTNIPHWIRGKESATLLEPRHYEMSMLGLGGSVGTSADGITAEVLVVHSFDDLHARAAEVSADISR